VTITVAAPLVIAANTAGLLRYHYAGAVIADIDAAECERLLASGMLVETADPAPAELAEPGADQPGPGDTGGNQGTGDQGDGGDAPERPKQAAPKEAWVAYAKARGMTEAEAEAMTKPELIGRLA
jgi:hypothetical protein